MARGDISVIGVSGGARPYRVAASVTRGYAGEPIRFNSTLISGVMTLNTVVAMEDAKPAIATDIFVGIAQEDMKVTAAGVVVASDLNVVVPIGHTTRLRGKAKDTTTIDTDAELRTYLGDAVLFDLTSSVYTFDQDAASADTNGLTIVGGIPHRGLLDVTVDSRALRADVS